MPTIRFQTNVPVELRLRSIDGKPVESQFGGIQYMFGADEGAFYVSDIVGGILMEQFRKLGVRPGVPVEIVKAEVAANGRKRIQWQVALVGEAPEPEPPSELEQKLADSIALAEARKQPQKAPTASAAPEMLPWQTTLLNQTKALTDVYAAALAHAGAMHGNTVKADDVRTFVVTTFINATKGATRNAA